MVKIALDTENCDKIIEKVEKLDSYIEKWEKEKEHPIPDEYRHLFEPVIKEELTTKNLTRKDKRLLNKIINVFLNKIPVFEKWLYPQFLSFSSLEVGKYAEML